MDMNDRIPRFIACRRSIFLINTSNMVIPHAGLVIPLIRREGSIVEQLNS